MKLLVWGIGITFALLLVLGIAGSGRSSYRADKVDDICSKAYADAAPGAEKRGIRQICDEARKNIK